MVTQSVLTTSGRLGFGYIMRRDPQGTLKVVTSTATSRHRVFSSSSDNRDKEKQYPHKIRENNPFDVLGIPRTSSYDVVKRRFVELALQHHPDVSDNNNDNDDDIETFVRLRQAFDAIRESSDGSARLAETGESWSDEEFQAWFYEETGHQDVMFKMDMKTRREVIDIVKSNQAQGGLDHGGMWEMARSMAQQEENLKKKKPHAAAAFKGIDSAKEPEPRVRRRRRKT